MYTIASVLLTARVTYAAYAGCAAGDVVVTEACQLVATYKALRAFVRATTDYKGWQAHHVVEKDDLDRLGVRNHAPDDDHQLCVLLPKQAHIGRINSILRAENPTKYQATARELLAAYAEAYGLIGNYAAVARRKSSANWWRSCGRSSRCSACAEGDARRPAPFRHARAPRLLAGLPAAIPNPCRCPYA